VKLTAINHVQLAMPAGQESRARAFYADLLGLAEVPKPPNLAKRGGAWFESLEVKVHLGVDNDFRPATKAHIAFEVHGLAKLIKSCREAGYPVVDDEPLQGYFRVYIHDPFGNRLEFLEPRATGSSDAAGSPDGGPVS
jgi:catechol 2,3-dioxygenase-like lactoylglutathione lyase family enzyme